MIVKQHGVTRRRPTTRKSVRGYAKSRMAYDRRRRRAPLDAIGKFWKEIVQNERCCSLCGKRELPLQADHIQGLNAGGENVWQNLGGICGSCNKAKKDTPLIHFMLSRLAHG